MWCNTDVDLHDFCTVSLLASASWSVTWRQRCVSSPWRCGVSSSTDHQLLMSPDVCLDFSKQPCLCHRHSTRLWTCKQLSRDSCLWRGIVYCLVSFRVESPVPFGCLLFPASLHLISLPSSAALPSALCPFANDTFKAPVHPDTSSHCIQACLFVGVRAPSLLCTDLHGCGGSPTGGRTYHRLSSLTQGVSSHQRCLHGDNLTDTLRGSGTFLHLELQIATK